LVNLRFCAFAQQLKNPAKAHVYGKIDPHISTNAYSEKIGALKNLSYKDATDQGEVLLEKLGLFPDKDKIIQAYSGGMRRRLGLAQAFLGAPECLIIDEPTAELDSVTANIVNRLIFDHASKAVIIMTTHLAESMSHLNYETLDLGAAIISSKIDA